MTIDRIGSVDPIQPEKRTGRVSHASGSPGSDSINISAAAQERAELFRIRELVAAAPETRAELVAELREKINDPSYINDRVINATADRLMDTLFG
ncbi:MAG: flagellar biosynthesis anti-sigma factor FlgM [Treponema sp.]|nr:flagellar biosynthesis anti-sigma factor FlgM [Treponema sp.]